MKRVWIAVGILFFVAALCITALLWQLRAIDRLEQSLHTAETAVRQGSADAAKKTEAFHAECIHTLDQLASLSRHIDSFPLRESASQLPVLLELEDLEHFYAEVARCRFYLNELRRSEKPLFSNIF